jgi:hypothetical protein
LKLMRSTPFAPFSLMVLLQQREQALQQQIAAASRAAPIPPVVVAQSAVTQRLAPPISIRGTLVPGTATRSVLAPVVTGPVLPGALLPVSSGSVPAALANTVASSTTAPAQAMIPGDVASPGLFYGGGSSVSSPSSGVSGPAVTSGASSNSLLWIGGAAVIVFMLSRGRH